MGQRVLVTGASGFVGSRVAQLLLARGWKVDVVVRQTSNRARLERVRDDLTFHEADLTDKDAMRGVVSRSRPDGVIHLGWIGVQAAARNLPSQIENVSASLDLYRFAANEGCRAFVGLGSQAEYGPASGRLSEAAATRPTTVYGAAKLAAGTLLERLGSVDGIPVAWLRLFSSYGPGDDPSWMIQYVARKLLAGERPAVTAAEQVWDYIHVDDAAAAVVSALEKRIHGFFNLGSGTPVRLREVLELLRDLVDPRLPLGIGEVPYRSDQVMHLEANIDRLRDSTGWRPVVPLETGLREVVDWLRREGV